MYKFFFALFFVIPFTALTQSPVKKEVKYGLIKKDVHGYYTVKDTILPTWGTLDSSFDKNYTKTIFRLNDCKNFNLTFKENGRLIYNNIPIGKYSTTNDSLFFDIGRKRYRKRISNLTGRYSYSQKDDTLILNTNYFSLFYLPCTQFGDSSYHNRPIRTAFYNWGIVGGVNYQFNSMFYELGVAKSEQSDNAFYSGDFYLDFNPKAGIVGFNASAYMVAIERLKKFPMSFIAIGANFNTYTNFDKVNVGLKPLVGFRLFRHNLTGLYLFYGYNIFLNKKRIPELNHNVFELKFNFPLFINKEKHISHQMYYFEGGGARGRFDADL